MNSDKTNDFAVTAITLMVIVISITLIYRAHESTVTFLTFIIPVTAITLVSVGLAM
jgi:energy-converting hydrogenase Eha subunit E